MFGKKIFFLASGYILGNVIHSAYGVKKKNKSETPKKEIEHFFENFMETQKNLMKDFEKKYLTKENKKLFLAKKEEFLEKGKKYMDEGKSMFEDLQNNQDFLEKKQQAQSWFSRFFSLKNESQDEKTEENVLPDDMIQDVKNEVLEEAQKIKKKSIKSKKAVSKKLVAATKK